MDFVPGATIGGHYTIERKLAEGGMGEVWIGRHAAGTPVAVKRLLAEAGKDREVVTRFRREALLLSKIRSDHVSKVIEQLDDPHYGALIIMEYVDGESLQSLLDTRAPLGAEEVVALGVDVGLAIADLHRANIVHRDIKPENVILRKMPNGQRRAVLIDFGLARLLDVGEGKGEGEETLTGITRADTGVGTIAYMAPEQILNSRDVNRSADVYALGAILYRAATGAHVFGDVDDMTYARTKLNQDPPALSLSRKDPLAKALVEVIGKALKRRHKERYETMDRMLADLKQASALSAAVMMDEPTQAAPVSALLGSKPASLTREGNAMSPADARAAFAQTMIPGLSSAAEAPPPVSVRVAPAMPPVPQRPPQAATMPLLSQSPVTSPSPASQLGSAPPMMSPVHRASAPSIPDFGAGGGTVRLPNGARPSLQAEPGVRKPIALVGFAIALVIGLVVGFVAHAALVDAPVCPPQGATPTK